MFLVVEKYSVPYENPTINVLGYVENIDEFYKIAIERKYESLPVHGEDGKGSISFTQTVKKYKTHSEESTLLLTPLQKL